VGAPLPRRTAERHTAATQLGRYRQFNERYAYPPAMKFDCPILPAI